MRFIHIVKHEITAIYLHYKRISYTYTNYSKGVKQLINLLSESEMLSDPNNSVSHNNIGIDIILHTKYADLICQYRVVPPFYLRP